MSAPRPPGGLSRRASAFWRLVVGEYDLEAPHLELLRSICRLMDRADQLDAAIGNQLTVPGSKGQPRPNPLVGEERQTAVALARLLRELDLEGEPAPSPRPPGLRRNT